MQITSKRYTEKGTDRFGSAIFIDDLQENRVDSVSGYKRNQAVLIGLIILTIVKFLTANIIGIIVVLPLYLVMYFYTLRVIQLHYTEHRILIETEYEHQKLARIFASLLVVVSVFEIIEMIFPIIPTAVDFRLSRMGEIFGYLHLYDNRFFLYQRFIRGTYDVLQFYDTISTILISLWIAYQLGLITYDLTEINQNHVSEQLLKIKSINSLRGILLLLATIILTQHFLLTRFSLLFVLLAIALYQFVPRDGIIFLSLTGPSNRVLESNIAIKSNQTANLTRTTAITFGWKTQHNQLKQQFPENLVPREVASIFNTGLQTYSETAYRQANILGAIISTITNLIIIIALIRYVIISKVDAFDAIFYIAIGLLGLSVLIFAAFEMVNTIRTVIRSEEKLLIGEGFVGRSIRNSLWIVKGSSMEGTTVQQGNSKKLIRYDRARGLIIEWERFTLLIIISVIVIIIGIWDYIGAINLRVLPLVFPSLINFGVEFIENKAQAELEYFIILGYITWTLVIFLYPRYYARSRPSLFLDMEYASFEPILLKDFKEHQDASIQFTKSLVHSSSNRRRNRPIRPGTIMVEITISGQIGVAGHLIVTAGQNRIEKRVSVPLEEPCILFENLITSGLKGYTEVPFYIELYVEPDELVFSTTLHCQMLYTSEVTEKVDLGSYGEIELELKETRQKP